MTRQIKFRAWDTVWKKMVYGPALAILSLEESTHHLMPFTGLTDKNGVPIYEGDIVRYDTYYYGNHRTNKMLVEWKDDLKHDGFGEPLAMGYIFHGSNIEVIGNIWEHPHLLKNV